MSIQFNEENGGRVLAVHVSGKLVKADYEQFVPEFERLVRLHGKLRVLLFMTLAILIVNFYPLTAVMIVMLA